MLNGKREDYDEFKLTVLNGKREDYDEFKLTASEIVLVIVIAVIKL
jgi:hypothetical protein